MRAAWCSDPGKGLWKKKAQKREGNISKAGAKCQAPGLAVTLGQGALEEGNQGNGQQRNTRMAWFHMKESCPALGWADKTGSEPPITRCLATGYSLRIEKVRAGESFNLPHYAHGEARRLAQAYTVS